MLHLFYYPDKTRNREISIESNSELNYKALIPISGTQIDIYSLDDELIGQVDGTHIELHGKKLPIKQLGLFNWAWVLNDTPEKLLSPDDDDNYLLDGEVVVFFENRTPASWTIFDLFKGSKIKSDSDTYIKLTYDETKIDELTAFSLLLVKVSKKYHSL